MFLRGLCLHLRDLTEYFYITIFHKACYEIYIPRKFGLHYRLNPVAKLILFTFSETENECSKSRMVNSINLMQLSAFLLHTSFLI